MVSSMKDGARKSVGTRLNRIEGQVRGIARMVDENRYCIDILTQVQAVRAALHKVEEELLKDHVQHCVANAFKDGDAGEQREKIDELVNVLGRLTRQ